jgi:hypothetical protein
MDGNDQKNQKMPELIIVERRRQRDADLSAADIMKMIRKRAGKVAGKKSVLDAQWYENEH